MRFDCSFDLMMLKAYTGNLVGLVFTPFLSKYLMKSKKFAFFGVSVKKGLWVWNLETIENFQTGDAEMQTRYTGRDGRS